MTLEQFSEITAARIPTPAEFVAFAEGRGWRFRIEGDRAALMVSDSRDPLARAFAKMLGREPYRRNVLDLLANRGSGKDSQSASALPGSGPEVEFCQLCSREVTDMEDRARLADPLYCDQAGSPEVRDKAGKVIREAQPRCPYKS